uniref:Uncharacterized protein n=1 Tax=Candidatus Methanogaster sp. ANME-2c ERB4 TaxID=2759911 RepID=A0A7G9Y7R0_9EURY|nr:hypothetical protein FKOJFBEA_00002 [Methanosarcinales archaeon ANME-2c ERB4]
MATSRIWDYPRGLRYHLHEDVRWSLIRRSRQFSGPCCRPGGGARRYSRLVVSLLRCGGEMHGMKSLCTGSGLKFVVW